MLTRAAISDCADLTGGACLDPNTDPDVFYPSTPGARQQEEYALSICAECPLRDRCLTDALTYERRIGYSAGIWGNTTAAQRAALLGGRVAV
jgi:hypothetical protein